MYFAVKVFPLCLHFAVAFEFGVCLAVLEAHLHVYGYEVGKEQRVHALALVVGLYSHEQQVERVGMFEEQCYEQVEPSEGEELSCCLLQCARD